MGSGSNVLDRLDAFSVEGIGPQDAGATSGPRWVELVKRAARSNCTILITGETGVGKEHLALWIHHYSPRRREPFVPVNCGAIPESLVDSQLFGHTRGSFTGATAEHVGLVRAAAGGTLFLDEVGDLPISAQSRLLRLLQEREVQPVGAPRPVTVDVRVIAAANRDLRQVPRFREDLLFRLDVVQLRVKPLRERITELSGLLEAFNAEFAQLYAQPRLRFDPRALRMLKSYGWPGNIRQLRSVVERLHVLSPGATVTAQRLVEIGRLWEEPGCGAAIQPMRQVRSDAVKRVLADAGGSVSRAAAVFGVHRSTIYRWLRQA
jgi:transcriptional regulator with PAS, ATPase and Fis domain